MNIAGQPLSLLAADRLAKRFRDGMVTEKERLIYLLLYLAADGFFSSSILAGATGERPLLKIDYLTDMVLVLGNLFGTVWLYRTNAKGDHADFISRYVCLGVPVLIQSMLVIILFGGLLFWLPPFVVMPEPMRGSVMGLVATTGLQIIYFLKLNHCLKIASHPASTD